MSINRTRLDFDRGFVRAPNDWVRDQRLSRRARGLLVELLSHNIGWKVTIRSLVASGPEGPDAIRSMIAELEGAGYLKRTRERNENGSFAGVDYELADPAESNTIHQERSVPPVQVNPVLDNPHVGAVRPKEEKVLKEDNQTQEEQILLPAEKVWPPAAAGNSVAVPAGKPAPKKGHRLPTDFAVTPDMVRWAQDKTPGVDGSFQTEQFVDYWTAASGASACKQDWVAAWRVWMRKALQDAHGRAPRSSLEDKVRSTRESGRRLQAAADAAAQGRLELGS